MEPSRSDLAGILKEIERQKKEIADLINAGRPMTDPMVIHASQRLDMYLNSLYNLNHKAKGPTHAML